MFTEIGTCKNLKKYFADNEMSFDKISFSNQLKWLIVKNGQSKRYLIEQRNIEKSYFYQILSARRNPSRDKILKIALAMKLNLGETQRLLIAAEKSVLYPKRKKDAVIICCINNQHNLHETQIALHEMEIEILD